MNKQTLLFLTEGSHVHALGPSPRAADSPAARVNKLILCVARINSGSWALLRPGPDPLGRRRCASCSGLLHVPVSHVLLFLVDVDLAIDSS